MKSKYQHLFFDLDHTLWDFETNSQEALLDLYQRYDLEHQLNAPVQDFLKAYYQINDALWKLYREGKVTKADLRHQRFQKAFHSFGPLEEEVIAKFEEEYMSLAPQKTALMPGTLEMLSNLKGHFNMHIITNGFEETQKVKLQGSGLAPFFEVLMCSDTLGINKPESKIFVSALKEAGAHRKNSLMIGDNLQVDILGARNTGIDQVYYNPQGESHTEKPTLEIRHWSELPAYLLQA